MTREDASWVFMISCVPSGDELAEAKAGRGASALREDAGQVVQVAHDPQCPRPPRRQAR